jgi:hypothetical protein
MRTRSSFRVILHSEHRKLAVTQPLHGAVVEIYVRYLEVRAPGMPLPPKQRIRDSAW